MSAIAGWLRDIIRCPACQGELRDDDSRHELTCTRAECGLRYPIVDGIPVLLVSDAVTNDPSPQGGTAERG